MVDAYKRCREYLDAAIELVRPGCTTGDIAALWPKATEFGFPNEEAAFALQYGHGVGLAIWRNRSSAAWSRSSIRSRSTRNGVCARDLLAVDRWLSAARIEEEVVVTDTVMRSSRVSQPTT